MRRFFAPPDSFESKAIDLDAAESHHLRDVLRLGEGEIVRLFDGEGREFRCRIVSAKKKAAALEIIEEVQPVSAESPIDLTLAAALLKGDKTDLCIQKAVELGVSRFIPLITSRTEKLLRNSEKQTARWNRIALDATKQCGRTRLMSVNKPAGLDELLTDLKGECFFFSERDGGELPASTSSERITIVVGPEGGWDDVEIELAMRSPNVTVITLAGRILRAETAAIVLTAIVQHRFGDLN
jgi:16S rRNA (uracil1498-N3)-methyltransferase